MTTRHSHTATPAWRSVRRGLLAAGVCCAAVLVLAGCATTARDLARRTDLAGLELVYRFDSGRTYRARYDAERVEFTLLVPRLDPPIQQTLGYRQTTLRPGLLLVVWTDPAYHTTFVVDLARRELHASALRAAEGAFVASATIVEIHER